MERGESNMSYMMEDFIESLEFIEESLTKALVARNKKGSDQIIKSLIFKIKAALHQAQQKRKDNG